MIGGRKGSGLEWLWRMGVQAQLDALKTQQASRAGAAELRARAAEKIESGATLTRDEAAAFIGCSTKKLQRMEARGQIRRCPALDGLVRYAARDVERLASAPGKEA